MPRVSLFQRTKAAFRAFTAGQSGSSRRTFNAFTGASGGRLAGDWNPFVQSPTQEIAYVLTTLRARARQLVRDNSYAEGFLAELANNVVGPEGIMLQAKIKTSRKAELHRGVNDAIEAAWLEWGMPEHATADGYESWTDFQRIVVRTLAQDGEFFIEKIPYFDNPFGFSVRLIDADLVDETYNRRPVGTENEIRLGIEVNKWGRPVAYHVWTAYPGEGVQRERVRIPAERIIHRFIRYRANQVRGVSWFAPVLMNLRMLDGYEFAELVAAKTSAAKMGFIKNTSEHAILAFDWEGDAKARADTSEPRAMEVEPGLIPELLPGQEFQGFDPTHPSTAFREFTSTVLQAIARGLGIAYTTLTGDLSAVNYSSIRAGLLSERDRFRALQRWFGVHVSRPIYRAWLPMAQLAGGLRLDSRVASDYYAVEWRGRGWKWVDPVNDLTAAALAIALGLNSRHRLAAEQGLDFEEIVTEIADELEIADAMGVDVSGAGKAPASPPQSEPMNDDGSNPDDTSRDQKPKDEQAAVDNHHRRIRALRLALDVLEKRAA